MSTDAKGTVRRRLNPAQRREEILDAATRAIATFGYNALTLDDFARAAAISRPGLLHHFASKQALLAAVLSRRDELDISELQDSPALGRDEARAALTALVDKNVNRRPLVQLYSVLAVEALSADHPAHDYFARRSERARNFFASRIVAWHPQPTAAAITLIAYLDGLQLLWLRDDSLDMMGQWQAFADIFFVPR